MFSSNSVLKTIEKYLNKFNDCFIFLVLSYKFLKTNIIYKFSFVFYTFNTLFKSRSFW